MKQKALAMVLSSKVNDKELFIIDKIELKNDKTKEINSILKNFIDTKKKNNKLVYIIVNTANKSLIRAARNLPFAYTTVDNSIDLVTLLNYKNVIILQDAISNLEQIFKKS